MDDIDALRRRGRRRLLGAIALVLLAVIVLPMVFDPEPHGTSVPVNVRIPDEDGGSFVPRRGARSSPPAPKAAELPAKADPAKPPAAAVAAPDAAVPGTPAAEPPSPARIPAGDPAGSGRPGFVIPVIALANQEKLAEITAMLAAANIPFYTEPAATAKGAVTRVRAGPFERRDAAEQALQKLKDLGIKPGAITQRPG